MKTHSNHPIKRSAILFLQIIIVLVGVIVLVALLLEPHLEGRNTNSTLFQVYFNDPFLAYIYLASIPFFVALYQAFKGLGYTRENKVFSPVAIKSLKTIKYCALIIAGSTVAADIYIKIAAQSSHDDSAGAVMLGIVITFVSVVVAAVAAVFEKILQNAVDMKSENDLTV
jgi:hypothetical protein